MNTIKHFLKSFLLWFAVFYVLLLGFQHFFGEEQPSDQPVVSSVTVTPEKKSFVTGNLVRLVVENQREEKITFTSPCERGGALQVFYVGKHEETDVSGDAFENCSDSLATGFSLEPGASHVFSLRYFNERLFGDEGTYKVLMDFSFGESDVVTIESSAFEIKRAGVFRQLFRAIVTKPLFNILVFFTEALPTHSFGWAIVMLTLLVRLLLFVPNQKAMRSQRELQKLQPKMDELRQKYKDNQQMMAMKTMELYKTHKVNPMGSCLPTLLQMPFLLGIYYIIRDGLSPHLHYLLYSFHKVPDLTAVENAFFGLDLAQNGTLVLALCVGLAQFVAVKLSFLAAKKKQSQSSSPAKQNTGPLGQMQQMNKVMLWVMPVMVAFFTTSFPAGVGVYWLTSTIFGAFQQQYVNWKLDQPQVRRR